MGTPNGVKVTIMLEELLAAGHADADYDAWLIRIGEGDQFGAGFVAANPNSKIPAMMDHSTDPPIRLFESGSILVYLAEKFGAFLPTDTRKRAETFNWLMWQMGSAPFVGGGFGHFYNYAPFKIEYAINRYAMETKRQLHVLDTHLGERTNIWPATSIRSPTWPPSPGTATCCAAPMARRSSCRCTNIRTSTAGWRRSRRARRCSAGGS